MPATTSPLQAGQRECSALSIPRGSENLENDYEGIREFPEGQEFVDSALSKQSGEHKIP